MTCVNTVLTLLQTSVAIHALVYVPVFGHGPITNEPDVFVYVIVPAQLSVATGANICADANPDASLHSNVTFREVAVVVHIGAI
jgi:hypothetical protein